MHGARQELQLLGIGGQLLRIGPHGIDRGAHRQRLTVPVRDRAPVRADGRDAREARGTLAGEETVLHELQLHGAAGERHARRQQQAEDHNQTDRKGNRPGGAAPAHGVGILMSFEAGMRMCRRVLATFST